MVPGAAFANGNMSEANCKGNDGFGDCYEKRSHHMVDKNWHEEMQRKQQMLLKVVSKYTPEKKKEWEAVIKERNTLKEKWSGPQFDKKRQQWKKEKMAKIKELHQQYEEGKMTKKEFLKKVHSEKEMGNWKIYQDLKDTIKNHNDQKTAQLLNQLLDNFKQKNEMMKAAMKS